MFSLSIGSMRYPTIPRMRELTPEEKEQQAKDEAEWQRREDAKQARTDKMIETAHLVTLTAASLQARARAGLWSMAVHEDSVADARYLLELIQAEPKAEETQP